MIGWGTLAKLALSALEEPDPKSPVERAKKVWGYVEEAGHAAELANEVMALSDPPKPEPETEGD